MKEVKAYQCSDGTVKTNKHDALMWERILLIRGILQKDGLARDGNMTPTTAANEIIKNFNEIRKIVDNFSRKLKALEKTEVVG